jgi:chorismate mutase
MPTKPQRARALPAALQRARRRMDKANTRLVAALQARARLAREIGGLKRELGLRGADPRREREMLARLLQDAPPGFERKALARILREVFSHSRALVEIEVRARQARR